MRQAPSIGSRRSSVIRLQRLVTGGILAVALLMSILHFALLVRCFSTRFSSSHNDKVLSPTAAFLGKTKRLDFSSPSNHTDQESGIHIGAVVSKASPTESKTDSKATMASTLTTINLPSGVVPKAFESWPKDKPLPCFSPLNGYQKSLAIASQPSTKGFFFMKLMKTGGSTAAGIHVRLSRNVARRQQQDRNSNDIPYCRGQWDHAWAHTMLQHRQRKDSFTWTLLRDPTARVVSQFFHFEVTRKGTSYDDETFQNYLWEEYTKRDALYQYYVRLLSVQRQKRRVLNERVPALIQTILQDYDFIGITERMDESAVALMMLLNLKMADILFLDAKNSGGYDDGSHDGKCYYIQPSVVSPGMKAYFQSSRWKRIVHWDEVLYQAANLSLDMTIDRLGREAFHDNLARFRQAQALARKRCLPRQVFPCSSTGERIQKGLCLWKDSGCGSDCLDEISTELNLW